MQSNTLTDYQKFIHKSRYARWNEKTGKREDWEDTINRYLMFFADELSIQDYDELYAAIHNMDIMPSMRCMMTAGKALARDQVAGFNCSYIAIDKPIAFDETMYILMCGTGLGFSCERQYINQLPEIKPEDKNLPSIKAGIKDKAVLEALKKVDNSHLKELYQHYNFPGVNIAELSVLHNNCIYVHDSKYGWASALRILVMELYNCNFNITWDVSRIRPAGARLKTFGGRASGPEPLVDLFNFTKNLFKKAKGRKLTSIECHDLMCKIADIVVVGGVRRSALISLSNLTDGRMARAKTGQWWVDEPQRALANNSVCYTEKPDMAAFFDEWKNLYESKSGERGIFNRIAAQIKAAENERRELSKDYGCNPCITGDTLILTDNGLVRADNLIGKKFTAIVEGKEYDSTEKGFWFTGNKQTYIVTTKSGHKLQLTDNHKLLNNGKWKELKDLSIGSNIELTMGKSDHYNVETDPEGYFIGQLIGDGTFDKDIPKLSLWVDNSLLEYEPYTYLQNWMETLNTRSDFNGWGIEIANSTDNYTKYSAKCIAFKEIASKFGVFAKEKKVPVENLNLSQVKGILQGLFDADGTVLFNIEKGRAIRLAQNDMERLRNIQLLLTIFGINSVIYANRTKASKKLLPDGKGGKKLYMCKAMHELHISNKSLIKFYDTIGFKDNQKQQKLKEVVESYTRTPNSDRLITKIINIEPSTVEPVYDCTIPDKHCFFANGILAHNCSEILLKPAQFCNLSEVVCRSTDNFDDLIRKVRLATILGTLQSTMVNFVYLNPEWRKNTEDEALLGVSLTGIMDNPLLNDETYSELPDILTSLKQVAIDTNKIWADALGINQSAAITCVKPSGTVSQLVDSASGIHARHSKYYIRTVRQDNKDPLTQFLKDAGIPSEACVMKPESTTIFAFPMESPDEAVTRTEKTAIEQLEHWLLFQRYWCEHKPSVTVYVKEHEWLEVGAWVYKYFDEVSGVSFLPFSEHIYKQAPYQDCTKSEYEKALAKMPKVEWSNLQKYETTDETTGTQELACVAGGCEI